MAGLATLAPRLSPLLGKLGSPHDGEVIAAARAASRLLEKAGLGWNDLGRILLDGPSAAAAPTEGEAEANVYDWRDDLAELGAGWSALEPHERSFARNLTRLARRGLAPTERQRRWLAVIAERLRDGGAADE